MKKPIWLLPVLGVAFIVYGITLTDPKTAGIIFIIIGAIGTYVGVGIWSDSQ